MANLIIAQLLFLESEDPDRDIHLYINSPGGVVTAGMAIYDTMQYLKAPVSTICVGQAASMGAVLLTAGEAGKRFALPNARVMIHGHTHRPGIHRIELNDSDTAYRIVLGDWANGPSAAVLNDNVISLSYGDCREELVLTQ